MASVTSAKPLPATTAAHYSLIASLIATGEADKIVGNADHIDIEDRANHIQAVMAAVTSYVKAVVADTIDSSAVLIHDNVPLLADAAADIVGELRNAADARSIDRAAA